MSKVEIKPCKTSDKEDELSLVDLEDSCNQDSLIGNPPFLTDGQLGFFVGKQRFLDEITPATETEKKLKTFASFLLKNLKELQIADNRRNKERAAEKERTKEILSHNNKKCSKAWGAMVACYRAIDRNFGDEIRAKIAHNFETEKQGRIKKAMEEIEKLSKGT